MDDKILGNFAIDKEQCEIVEDVRTDESAVLDNFVMDKERYNRALEDDKTNNSMILDMFFLKLETEAGFAKEDLKRLRESVSEYENTHDEFQYFICEEMLKNMLYTYLSNDIIRAAENDVYMMRMILNLNTIEWFKNTLGLFIEGMRIHNFVEVLSTKEDENV